MPDLRVGIVSWNTADELDRCLAALPAALDGLDAEVVVVDNASSDDSADVVRRHGVTLLANDANLGYAVAMNQALAGSRAPLLLALNPDTVPAPGTLRRLVEHAERNPAAGVIVPRLVGADGAPQPSAHRYPGSVAELVSAVATGPLRRSRLGRRLLLDGSGPHAGGPVDWSIGAVHLIRVAALDDEPPYSERSFMYAEDLDLCWRLTQRGWPTVLADDVEVLHVGNVAGAQAWGSARSARFWIATYDVVAQRRSPAAARATALMCTVAVLTAMVRGAVAGALHRDRGRVAATLAVRARELRVHARTAVLGPPPPPTSPPS